ncbi:MAG: diguanylate cyclase, partial [Planctomycetes bacterium]|nr:diguanylate cyclase [Planctomycetota bacterium]
MNPAAELLLEYLGDLLYTPNEARLDVESLPEDFRDLGRGLLVFQETLDELRSFAMDLSKGNLAMEPPARNELAAPLKSLHASLRHLTWQSKQVAMGDYRQRVQFMGEFSDAFNTMIHQLDERRQSLLDEIEKSQQKTLALEQSVTLFTALTQFAPQWIIALERENKSILFANQAAKNMLSTNTALAARLWAWVEEDADIREEAHTDTIEITTAQNTWYLSVAVHPLAWPPYQAVIVIVDDESEARKRLQELENVAYSDSLTNVSSRFIGMRILHEWIDARKNFCICFVDIDYLKYVNDTFGHSAGDEYIISVAKLLNSFSRDALVCRLGGDEFMVLQRDWTEQRAEDRFSELRGELGLQNTGPGQPYTRSISYGVVEVPSDNSIPESELLSAADEKMYRFKQL